MLFIWALCLEKISSVTKNIRNVNECRVGKLIKDTFYTCNRNKKDERLQICKITTKFMSLDRLNTHRIV